MNKKEDSDIWNSYILNELFEKTYNIQSIETFDGKSYKSFDELFEDKFSTYIDTIAVTFLNAKQESMLIQIFVEDGSLCEYDNFKTMHISYDIDYRIHPSEDKFANRNSDDTSVVVSTVFEIISNFTDTYKKYVNQETWDKRVKHGIFIFEAMESRNKITPPGKDTQRSIIYKAAFNKKIKPKYPQFNFTKIKNSNYYIIN